MPKPHKEELDQRLTRRSPRQERSRLKVELIFEAATRLLQEADLVSVSTNAIAQLAGISIGTLYQYFPDKDALFDALAKRELAELSERIVEIVAGPPPEKPGGRITAVVAAVLDAHGGRGLAHRRLMQHSLSRGSTGLLGPLIELLQAKLTQHGVAGPTLSVKAMSAADAFVLTQAVNGVLRAALMAETGAFGGREALEQSLTRLVLTFLAPVADGPG